MTGLLEKYIAEDQHQILEQDTSHLDEESMAAPLYLCLMMKKEIIGMDHPALNVMDMVLNAMKNMFLLCAALLPQTVEMGCLILPWKNVMMEIKAMMMTALTRVLSGCRPNEDILYIICILYV